MKFRISILLLNVSLIVVSFFLFSFSKKRKTESFGYCYNSINDLKQSYEQFDCLLDFKQGNKIADVGAQHGTHAVELLYRFDSVEIYTEDIDTSHISNYKISELKNYYSKLDSKILNHPIYFYKGNEQKTFLPENYFDAILLTDVLHEVKFKTEFLNDLKTKIRSNGCVYVFEILATKTGKKFDDCGNDYLQSKSILELFQSTGFAFKKRFVIDKYSKENSDSIGTELLIFSKV